MPFIINFVLPRQRANTLLSVSFESWFSQNWTAHGSDAMATVLSYKAKEPSDTVNFQQVCISRQTCYFIC